MDNWIDSVVALLTNDVGVTISNIVRCFYLSVIKMIKKRFQVVDVE